MRAYRLANVGSHKEHSKYSADSGEVTRINLNDRDCARLEDPLKPCDYGGFHQVATLIPTVLGSHWMLARPRVLMRACHFRDVMEWKKE